MIVKYRKNSRCATQDSRRIPVSLIPPKRRRICSMEVTAAETRLYHICPLRYRIDRVNERLTDTKPPGLASVNLFHRPETDPSDPSMYLAEVYSLIHKIGASSLDEFHTAQIWNIHKLVFDAHPNYRKQTRQICAPPHEGEHMTTSRILAALTETNAVLTETNAVLTETNAVLTKTNAELTKTMPN
ncbi:hypothetical protein BS47DRAFT_601864 [Hydnum rufescens UP504]|uniref:Uncharacterized protein n=1 Tax=Hydnum rufescens UP504 TaxID=1448309 RepID=A0A9P6AFC7_9AGAM|nr:hypothetical protein BS47DRAFT_601864 [Hydnum rufescens UP504]